MRPKTKLLPQMQPEEAKRLDTPVLKRIKAKSLSINQSYIENILYESKWLNHNDRKGDFLCISQKSMDFKIMS